MSQPGDSPTPSAPYILGHSSREIERLKTQAQLIDRITRQFLVEGGLAPGMRVLDVGSGAGDVAFLVADIVGQGGAVVGIDRSPAALTVARSRATERSLEHVSFVEGDPLQAKLRGPFDAVVGRYVLQFQPDPARMLRKLAGLLRSDGLLVFHEIDWSGLQSYPTSPLFDRCCALGLETLQRHGTETRRGCKLHNTFVRAGLPAPAMRLEAPIGGGVEAAPWLRMLAELIATLEPEAVRLGVADAHEIDSGTLAERLVLEATQLASVIVGHAQVGAWVRV